MMRIKGRSAWTFDTSSSIGAGLGPVSIGHGSLYLTRPGGKVPALFDYTSVSTGASLGFNKQLPKLGKVPVGAGYADKSFWNAGAIWIMSAFEGSELDYDDFTGFCQIADAVSPTFSVTVMFLGMKKAALAKEVVKNAVTGSGPIPLPPITLWGYIDYYRRIAGDSAPNWLNILDNNAKAAIVIGGRGLNAYEGVSAGWGYVSNPAISDDGVVRVEHPHQAEETTYNKTKSSAQDDPFIPGDALFDFDRDIIKPEAAKFLVAVGEMIRKNPGHLVELGGYTDNIGGAAYNQDLSERRANAVKTWLVSHGYVKESSVKAVGFGMSDPVASNNTWQGREQNRRVVIHIR